MAQPEIQTGYMMIKGGLGTVTAMVNAQPTLTAQAVISKQNLNGQA
jgi:hypothetical protein